MEQTFRVVIFSAVSPHKIRHFLWRLETDLPEVQVAGVLLETPKAPLPLGKRIKRLFKLMGDAQFRSFAIHKAIDQLKRKAAGALDSVLQRIHCSPKNPNGAPMTREWLAKYCESKGIALHVTRDFHAEESLAFVKGLQPNLGVIFGTRILKPDLFGIPERGSVNIHKHKVPEYRGSGAPGLWEMRDGKTEQTVTVHRVLKAVDAGAVLGERSFAIDQFDTLVSVQLKADLLAIDVLVDVVRSESTNTTVEVPQTSEGTIYKGYKPHQIFAIEQEIRRKRKPYRVPRGRSALKLLPRMLAYPGLYFRNTRRKKQQKFPVVMLFHHLVTDKPKDLGQPTEEFLRHVRFLKKHYKIASLPEALEMLRKDEVPAPTVVLTFDDGYADNFLGLRAIAEAENIPVTLFVCTQHVTDGTAFDHDLSRQEGGFRPLTWNQVRYFDRHNVTIGSHTRNHFNCGSTDRERLTDEIGGSRKDLSQQLGHETPYFSFPKGQEEHMSEPALKIATENYPFVFSAIDGITWGPLGSSRLLHRCSHRDSLLELELLLQSVLEFDLLQKPEELKAWAAVAAET